MDVQWGFKNVRIRDGDQWKAAFLTEFGLFEPLVMYFGLCNLPSTFQRLMDKTFFDMIRALWLEINMDDTNVHTKGTIEHHKSCVWKFLQRCREENLFLKINKCEFLVPEMDFVGAVISKNSVKMNPLKTKAIREWPTPARKKDLQSFLGFANYYRRFIRNFSEIALPLN
jgi:hypothetical protein